jgi:HEAT repeat protein
MKVKNIFLTGLALLMLSVVSFSQDKRTLETKVADLVAQFPVNDLQYLDKLMSDMISIGEEGQKRICDQIIPAGTGDDTKQRFAVESYSRFLSSNGKENERSSWETICISYASTKDDAGVKDFFMKQLQTVGGEKSAGALKMFISDKENCSAAIAAITATGGKTAEHILAEALMEKNIPCAAAVMNALAEMNSQEAVNEYITRSADENVNIKAAALNALARSGSPLAYPVLLKAAQSYSYRWERTGATSALLNYAAECGENGNINTADKICKLLIAKCNDKLNMQNKIAALKLYTDLHGAGAMTEILKASAHPDSKYRNAAINMSASIKSGEVTKKWLAYFPKAIPEARPEIIRMLGTTHDPGVMQLLKPALRNSDAEVRQAAAEAIAKNSGGDAAPFLISYLKEFQDPKDQEAAASAFKSIAGNKEVALLKDILIDGPSATRKSAIELIAWNKDPAFFQAVLSCASSEDEQVKTASFDALAALAEPNDQDALIRLLSEIKNAVYVADIQSALASAAGKISDPEKRSATLLKAMEGTEMKAKLIPVLAKTGGREALSAVLKEFENGNPEMRSVCFTTLSAWNDFTASSALFEICASGNKSYEEPAFNGYIRQLKTADMPDDQKLLLYRKIMPFALSPERKNVILTELGNLKTYLSLFFVAGYLDDPATATVAAKSAMLIALPSANSKNGMYGYNIRDILTKAATKLTGSESEYDREMIKKYISAMLPDEGFVPMFNGRDLSGWQGLVENPAARSKMTPAELAAKQVEADKKVPANWSVKDGSIWFNGSGENLCSIKEYGDFEMLVDWKISKKGDSGIYLRGSPQVQIWDTSRVDAGAQVGSGGLYNNQINPSKPLQVADNPVGDWNTFRIIMTGEKVSVWLNGILVVDNVTLENYWDRKMPIFPKGSLELQAHGTDLGFRDIYVREIKSLEYNLTPEEKAEGFVSLFNGRNLDGWIGDKVANVVEDGIIVTKAEINYKGNKNIYTEKEYADFIFRFDFLLTPGGNNGLGIRAPLEGDAAYVGMELQILDNTTTVFGKLEPYQMHGSVYGVIPAKTGYLKPLGEWNSEEVIVTGTKVKVILNGTVILDGDINEASKNGTLDHNEDHIGLKNKTGHIGFLYHNSVVRFRNVRIKNLSK